MSRRARTLLELARDLSRAVSGLSFSGSVAFVYNPLDYARKPHAEYLRRYGAGRPAGRTVLLGMNPGPFGMAQTGVPFGEVGMVRDWLGIDEPVERPQREHPKRPIEGFACSRSEVSGSRLWGWARDRFGAPEAFFERFFVVNYCPLLFLAEGGRNLTPDKLAAGERAPLLATCDQHLERLLDALVPGAVVGVGAFAERCARRVYGERDLPLGRILHPSPASPAANRGWAARAERELAEMGLL